MARGTSAAGVLGLLGDVACGLEAVEDVDRREHRDQQRAEIRAAEVEPEGVRLDVLHALGGEQVAEAVVEPVDGEHDREADGAEDLVARRWSPAAVIRWRAPSI